jgi:hypothetical protein
MAISSVVFYTLAARAPLVSPKPKPTPRSAQPNLKSDQAGPPHHQRHNHNHLLHNLPGPIHRPRRNLERRPHHPGPQTRPKHPHRHPPPSPLAPLHQLGPQHAPTFHQLRPHLRSARCQPPHRNRRQLCHARDWTPGDVRRTY